MKVINQRASYLTERLDYQMFEFISGVLVLHHYIESALRRDELTGSYFLPLTFEPNSEGAEWLDKFMSLISDESWWRDERRKANKR